MIRYLRQSELNRDKWNDCISQANNSMVYAYSWYLDNVCENWDALVEDDYSAVMPLPYRKKAVFLYIFPPSLIQQLGVFSPSEVTEEKLADFIKAIPKKFRYTEINLNYSNPAQKVFKYKELHVNLELYLNRPYQEIKSSYSENLRRNLKKIPENLLSIRYTDDIMLLTDLFKSNQAKKIGHLPKDYYQVLNKIFKAGTARALCKLYTVYLGDQLCAGALFFICGGRAIFLFSATNDKAKEVNAMHFLIDSFIKEHAQSHLILDFEGSDNESLARFYRSFGAAEKNYYKIFDSIFPYFIIKFLKFVFKIKKVLS